MNLINYVKKKNLKNIKINMYVERELVNPTTPPIRDNMRNKALVMFSMKKYILEVFKPEGTKQMLAYK